MSDIIATITDLPGQAISSLSQALPGLSALPAALPAFPAPAQMCGVMALLQAGQGFASTASGAIFGIKAQLTAVTGLITNLPSVLQGLEASIIAGFEAQLSGVISGVIGSLEAHLASQLAGLLGNLSIAAAHLAAQAGLAGTGGGCQLPSNTTNPAADPCFNMSKLFGSLTGGATPMLDGITAQLTKLTGFIGGLAGSVSGALSQVTAMIGETLGAITGIASQITDLISKEVAALGTMLNELLNFAHISSLFGLLSNPCAKQVLGSVATPAMATALGL